MRAMCALCLVCVRKQRNQLFLMKMFLAPPSLLQELSDSEFDGPPRELAEPEGDAAGGGGQASLR